MKKVMIVMIAVALSVSMSAFAWAGCGGCGFNGKAGYGCYGLQGGNCTGSCCSISSYIQSAAMRCCTGMLDFFKGTPNSVTVPRAATSSQLQSASLGSQK